MPRRRLRRRIPPLAEEVAHLLRLATADSTGPDPEAALPFIEDAKQALAAFLKATPRFS